MASVKDGAVLKRLADVWIYSMIILLWYNHEFLESQTATSMGSTVENIHKWDWQNVWFLGPRKIGYVSVEGDILFVDKGTN